MSVVPSDSDPRRILAEDLFDHTRAARLCCPFRLDDDPVSCMSPHVASLIRAIPPAREASAIVRTLRVAYDRPVKTRVVVLGAGFGGLELSTMLSDALGDDVDVTLIDKSAAFVFGYSKLDVMFGRTTLDAVRLAYRDIAKPGVRFLQQTVGAIDPEARRVTTDGGVHEADVLVVALGADYDMDATPGLAEGGNEFYSVGGAERLRELLPAFSRGRAIVGDCGAQFKCPPAPSECALLLDDYLSARGVRDQCEISLVMPFGSPVPPSPDTSRALLEAFGERDIEFVSGRRVSSLDPARRVAVLEDGVELPYDLFLGVPRHRAPDVVVASGMTEDGYVPVNPKTLETRFPGVYAVGDVATIGVPKAGVFAEGAARIVAASLIAALQGGDQPGAYDGLGSCYIEFGAGRVGRVDVDFLSGPKPTGTFQEPSDALVAEKHHFGSSRGERWFGRSRATVGSPLS
jgi:sulfide:quinone oxidoreductase